MEESSMPPVLAWRYISFMDWTDQLPFILYVSSDLTILSACVGHRQTHLWQFTHLVLSDIILPRSLSYLCTPL